MTIQLRIGAPHPAFADHEQLFRHTELMAELFEQMAERVHLQRNELWRLRVELTQQGVSR